MPDKPDAIALLKADHRKVEDLFAKFENAKGDGAKEKLAQQICIELTIHAMIEEEIFYPACKGKVEEDKLKEAYVEHDGAKVLIAEIEAGGPDDDYLRRQGQGAVRRDRAPRQGRGEARRGHVRPGAQGRARHGRARRPDARAQAGIGDRVRGRGASAAGDDDVHRSHRLIAQAIRRKIGGLVGRPLFHARLAADAHPAMVTALVMATVAPAIVTAAVPAIVAAAVPVAAVVAAIHTAITVVATIVTAIHTGVLRRRNARMACGGGGDSRRRAHQHGGETGSDHQAFHRFILSSPG